MLETPHYTDLTGFLLDGQRFDKEQEQICALPQQGWLLRPLP